MNVITIMEERRLQEYKDNWLINLIVEKQIIQERFNWLNLSIQGKVLSGKGCITANGKKYCVEINYSPFFRFKMDDIHITNHKIEYHDDIHVYGDLSLCLYHPRIDKPVFGVVPLHKMIPWITEWCHFYEEWKKYGVWLGKEIKHRTI